MKQDFTERQKAFNEALKAGSFKPAYLLCGEQAYLRLQNRDKLVKTLMGDGDDMNLTRFTGNEFTARDVIEMAETLPFFADRRVIVLENTELFGKASSEGDILADYLEQVPETTALVFAEKEVDKRKRLYKAIGKAGVILECDTPDERTLQAWAGAIFRREKMQISGRTLALFLEYAGEDMQNIASEAEKLCCYCMGTGEVREEDVREICTPMIRDRIFEMIEAISGRNRDKALRIYMDLCAMRTAPQVILSLMERQFNQLLQVKENLGQIPDRELAAKVKVPPFVLTKKYKPLMQTYTRQELVSAIEDCLQADQDYKSGKIDAQTAVEMIIVRRAQARETGGKDSSLQNRSARWEKERREEL